LAAATAIIQAAIVLVRPAVPRPLASHHAWNRDHARS
jgi:hypothetical protein